MGKTISNVLTGVAILEVGAPAGDRAEWSTEQYRTGSHSVKLSKSGDSNHGSTSVLFNPTGAGLSLTLQDFEDMAGGTNEWGYWSFREAVAAYWAQLELRFEDPNSTAWVDVTVQIDVMATGGAAWVRQDLTDADQCFFGGWSPLDGSFSNWTPANIDAIVLAVDGAAPLQAAETSGALWTLTRVRVELWEDEPPAAGRYEFIDSVNLDSVNYNFEPGDAGTLGIILTAPFTEVGYTEDGVTVEYTSTTTPIRVEEETFPVDAALDEENVLVTCNMAESSLFNMDIAMSGSLLSGNILKLGAGTLKKLTVQIRATNPASKIRAILIPSCFATGAVGMAYKKGEKTIVPVTFQALKTTGHPAVTLVDNAS